jgi:endonuclease YncB( thermonuclease family)
MPLPTPRASAATLLGIGVLAMCVAGCSSDEPDGDGKGEASRADRLGAPPRDRPKPPWKRPERRSRKPGPLRGDGGNSRSPAIPAAAKRTTVTGIVDGDTVDLAGLGSSRLIGVDTPEIYGGAECFGSRASAFAKRELPTGTPVFYEHGIERTDRYGRDLVYLWLPGGTFFNALLAKEGYAVTLTIPPNDEFAGLFRRLAASARRADRGLWAPSACAGNPDAPVGGASGGGSGGAGGSGGGTPPVTAGDRDCADFASQSEAQRYFRAKGGPGSDPDYLDGDGDGVACETLS